MSAWAKDEGEDSRRWADYYATALRNQFAGDAKIIAINCGTPPAIAKLFSDIPNTLVVSRAPDYLNIDSDGSGFQTCLKHSIGILHDYEAVLFLHSKGTSYRWQDHENLRQQIDSTILDRSKLEAAFTDEGLCLAAIRGHLPQTLRTCDETVRATRLLRLEPHHFSLAATYTLYAVSAARLEAVLASNGESLAGSNLSDLGFSRFFFEGPFASVLSHGVDRLEFLIGSELRADFNKSVCVDAFPRHNSFVTGLEFEAFSLNRTTYRQRPTPYVFGPPEVVAQIRIQYEP